MVNGVFFLSFLPNLIYFISILEFLSCYNLIQVALKLNMVICACQTEKTCWESKTDIWFYFGHFIDQSITY